MNILDWLKLKVLKINRVEKLADDPTDEKFLFFKDPQGENDFKIKEYMAFYMGDSNLIGNFYTSFAVSKGKDNPIYNRLRYNYFWSIIMREKNLKGVHSGLARAMIQTLTNIVGVPEFKVSKIVGYTNKTEEIIDISKEAEEIIKHCKLKNMINQKQMPLTLATGYGVFKPIIDLEISKDKPLLEYYNADRVKIIEKHGVVVGVIFKDFYSYKGKEYVLFETRERKNGDSLITYDLYRIENNNEITKVDIATIPELDTESYRTGLKISKYDKVLAVPSVFFDDPSEEMSGLSVLAGKIDLLDDLDQALSQSSQTCRVSTPVEYYPVDVLGSTKNGEVKLPKVYNRQYIQGGVVFPDGDGDINGDGKIQTTQPSLNFAQYNDLEINIVNNILTGVLSPSSLGINIAKDDNATAQREKEKTTIMTRDNIITRSVDIYTDLIIMLLDLTDYITKGVIDTAIKYDISVQFNEFANPSFESLSATLSPMLSSGTISEELYVDKLYGESLSKEEKDKEIARLLKKKSEETFNPSDFDIVE